MNYNYLIEIYKEAKKFFYNNNQNLNQKSKHWESYNLKNFTLDNLINFRNDGKLSEGLDDQTDKFTFKIYSEIVNKTSENFLLNNLLFQCDLIVLLKILEFSLRCQQVLDQLQILKKLLNFLNYHL